MPRSGFKYVVLIVLLAIAAVSLWGWSLVSRGLSARDEPGYAESFVARKLRRLAIPGEARTAKNPVKATPEVLGGAMEHFADHCATCHANDGTGNTSIGRGLYPKAPDMTQAETQGLTDGELYYIIENGIRFTGMPAFGEESAGMGSDESWALVGFIRHLPRITVDEIAAMKKMNPKSPAQLEKEERIRKFLQGEDGIPVHHH